MATKKEGHRVKSFNLNLILDDRFKEAVEFDIKFIRLTSASEELVLQEFVKNYTEQVEKKMKEIAKNEDKSQVKIFSSELISE